MRCVQIVHTRSLICSPVAAVTKSSCACLVVRLSESDIRTSFSFLRGPRQVLEFVSLRCDDRRYSAVTFRPRESLLIAVSIPATQAGRPTTAGVWQLRGGRGTCTLLMGTGHVPQLSHMCGARLPLGTPQGHLFPCLPFDRLCDAGSHCGLRDAPAGRHFFVVRFGTTVGCRCASPPGAPACFLSRLRGV